MNGVWKALRSHDDHWKNFLQLQGWSVQRTDDCFVSWQSEGAILWVANEADLDADDTLAQIILHELCHHLVEGTDSHQQDDWGLNNMTDDDLPNEYAALRLQAAILGTPLQRQYLQPTTDHRWFYEALGDQPLTQENHATTDPKSILLAQKGWKTWLGWPQRTALQALLVDSEACISRALAR